MEILKQLGKLTDSLLRTDPQTAAFEKIEQTGAIKILQRQAMLLREQGDPTVIVAENRSSVLSRHVMVELRWGLEKRSYLVASSWWQSKGVAMEATGITDPCVRYTEGGSWGYLHSYIGPHFLSRMKETGRLTAIEAAMLDSSKSGKTIVNHLPLEQQLLLAMKIAEIQADYRYGEGPGSERQVLKGGKSFRKIF